MCTCVPSSSLPAKVHHGGGGETAAPPPPLIRPLPSPDHTPRTFSSLALRAGLAMRESFSTSSYHFLIADNFCSRVVKRIFLSAYAPRPYIFSLPIESPCLRPCRALYHGPLRYSGEPPLGVDGWPVHDFTTYSITMPHVGTRGPTRHDSPLSPSTTCRTRWRV